MSSQFKEDQHIEAVFDEIGYGSRVLFDIGARLTYSNSANLIRKHGFTGVLVEASEEHCNELRRELPGVTVLHKKLLPSEVNEVCPSDCWFLTIDIDSCDWWMWANMIQRPALVVVETNPLNGVFVAPMEAGRKDQKGYGMSLEGAHLLAAMKGYDYIGMTEVNAFYVRKDLKCHYRLPAVSGHHGAACKGVNNVCAS